MLLPNETVTPDDAADEAIEAQAHFRKTLVRVMAVQVAALIVLWWLQARYSI
jgi:hypothetical protein